MRKHRFLSLFLTMLMVTGLLVTVAAAATTTGTGIGVSNDTNHWINRINTNGKEYVYKPALLDGRLVYCVDFGYSFNSKSEAFRAGYKWEKGTGADADAVLQRALTISGMGDFTPEVLENAKWMMSYVNRTYPMSEPQLGQAMMSVQTYLWDNMQKKEYGDVSDEDSNIDDGGYADQTSYQIYQNFYNTLLQLKAEEDAALEAEVAAFAAQGINAYITVDRDSQWAIYATAGGSGRQSFFNYHEKRIVAHGDIPDEPTTPGDPTDPGDPGDPGDSPLIIRKLCSKTNRLLPGATFRIEGIDVTLDTTVTTGADGCAYLEGDALPKGSYRVSELDPPEGFLPSGQVETIHFDGESPITVSFVNDPLAQITIQKLDANDGAPVSAVFDVYRDTQRIDTVRVDGTATLTGLTEGTYTFVEVSCPGNYILDSTPHSIHVSPGDNATINYDLIVPNQRKPGLEILKYDLATKRPLAGVTFAIYHDAALYGEFTTDETGRIYLNDIDPGTWTAQEIATTDGHVLNPTPQQIELEPGDTVKTLVFFNQTKPGIWLVKVDSSDLSKPIANAKFEIRAVDGSFGPEEFTTDQNGEIDLSKLNPGAYVVTELECPGYVIDEAQRIIQLVPDETAQFVFTNSKLPSVLLIKTSSDESPLEGVSFRLAKIEDGGRYLDRTTDENGQIVWEGLEPGVYSLRETYTVGDHILDLAEYHIQLFPGKVSEIHLENQRRPGLTIWKHDADTGEPVPNTVFLVEAADGHSVDEVKTDANGRAELKNLLPGVYEITEKSVPSPYLLDAPSQLVTLYPNRDHTVYFENHKKPSVTIIKEDAISGELLKNAKFSIQWASNKSATGEIRDLGVHYTDSQGRIVLEGLEDGWLKITELEPPSGYAIQGSGVHEEFIRGGETKTIRIKNEPLSALVVWKYDSVSGLALEGAVFQVKYLSGTSGSGGTVIGTFKTGPSGSFTVTGLEAGAYVVEELASDEDHVIDTASQTAYISGEEQAVVQLYFGNAPKGALMIKKVDSITKKPLSDVQFLVTDSTGAVVGNANGRFVTDSSGSILIEGIDPGTTLVARESMAKTGYALDDTPQTAIIQAGQTVTLEFRNQPYGSLLIRKLGEDNTPLADVEFTVTTSEGTVIGPSNGKYVTDSAGTILIDDLAPGTTLVVKESRAAVGYVLDSVAQTAVIKAGETSVLEFRNSVKGNLIIHKLSSADRTPLEGVEFSITYADGRYVDDADSQLSSRGRYFTDENGQITISGIVGTVVVTEVASIDGFTIDPDSRSQTVVVNTNDTQTLWFYNDPIGGVEIIKVNEADKTQRIPKTTFEIRKVDDELVDTVTTDKNGRVFAALEDGTYYAVEIEAGEGFKLDNTPHYFEVENGKTVKLQVTNQAYSGILIHKTDSTTGEGIYGVSFLLYDSNKNPIGEYVSDDRGYVYIDDLPASGRYYLRELEAEGYIVDEQLKTVYVTDGTTTEIVWKNTPITGQIQITKTSADYNSMNGWPAGTPIPNTVFEIYHYRTGNLVDTIQTDKNGVAVTKPLPLGRYKIVEVKAADFYGLDKTPIDVEIEHAGQIVKAAMTNKSLYTNVSIKKVGYTEVMPGQSIRYDFSGIANNSTTALTSFYWRDTLPTNAVRLDKIVTGTYNVQGNYKIVYKTNLSNGAYRTLADNLSTMQNYVLDASPAALGLAANEFVTEFMVSFGVVPANFRQVETPRVYCNVVSWLTGGTQFVNQADVGGVYDGQWIMATTRWVTTVYKPSQPLPRTGY